MLLFSDVSVLLGDSISVVEDPQERANIHDPKNL